MNADHFYDGSEVTDGRYRIVCTMGTERGWEVTDCLYDANRAEDGRMRSGCMVPSEKTL